MSDRISGDTNSFEWFNRSSNGSSARSSSPQQKQQHLRKRSQKKVKMNDTCDKEREEEHVPTDAPSFTQPYDLQLSSFILDDYDLRGRRGDIVANLKENIAMMEQIEIETIQAFDNSNNSKTETEQNEILLLSNHLEKELQAVSANTTKMSRRARVLTKRRQDLAEHHSVAMARLSMELQSCQSQCRAAAELIERHQETFLRLKEIRRRALDEGEVLARGGAVQTLSETTPSKRRPARRDRPASPAVSGSGVDNSSPTSVTKRRKKDQ
eukprot:PhM_4_TR11946/c0_g2_i1/m.35029